MGALTFDEFDDASPSSGALTFDEFDKPKKYNIGKSGLADAAREIMANRGWLGRNWDSMLMQGAKAVSGLTGGDKEGDIATVANVAAQEAPVGAFVGDVVKYAPAALAATAAAPIALPALAAGAIGFATTPGDIGERAAAGATDAALGYAGGKALQGITWGAKRIGNLSSLSAARKAAGDIVGEANIPAATKILDAAPNTISAEQALVGTNNPNVANLAKMTRGLSPQMAKEWEHIAELQRAARTNAMQGITPDLTASEAARKAASGPLYKAADRAVVTADAPMMDLFSRMPKGTMDAAADIARMEGRPFLIGSYDPATGQFPKITGESLHYIKRALSDISNAVDPARGIGRDAQSAARSVLNDFLSVVENKLPVYGTARNTFAQASVPVNQSKVLTAMTDKLRTQTDAESPRVFLNAMGSGEQAMLKKSTGYPRYGGLSDLLDPARMNVVDDVASQLQRDITLKRHRGNIASNQAVADVIKQDSITSRIPNMLWRPAMITNRLLQEGEIKANAAMMRKLANAMDNPKALSDLLKTLPIERRSTIVRGFNRIAKSGAPAVAGATLADVVNQQ